MTGFLIPDDPPAPADNLFLAATAYHAILAHALAADANTASGASVLVMKRQLQANFRELFAAVRADPASPFRDVYLLDRRDGKYKANWRAASDRLRVPALRKLLDAQRPRRLFLFNEDNLDQYAARRIKARGGVVNAVEDGAVAYTDQVFTPSAWQGLKSKLFFGPAAMSVAVEGGSRLIDTFYARFPAQLRPELSRGYTAAIADNGLKLFQRLTWPADYLQRLGVDPESLRYDSLLLLAHSGNFKHLPAYPSGVRETVQSLVGEGRRLAVSYHPRERNPDWLGLGRLGASLIPHAVPAELIYLFNKNSLTSVYGDIGTSLLTARWMLGQVPAISLMDKLGVSAPDLRALFLAVGIQVR